MLVRGMYEDSASNPQDYPWVSWKFSSCKWFVNITNGILYHHFGGPSSTAMQNKEVLLMLPYHLMILSNWTNSQALLPFRTLSHSILWAIFCLFLSVMCILRMGWNWRMIVIIKIGTIFPFFRTLCKFLYVKFQRIVLMNDCFLNVLKFLQFFSFFFTSIISKSSIIRSTEMLAMC